MSAVRPWLPLWLLAGAALAIASPPAILPGAEFVVFVGLGAWFVVATASPRPALHSYLLGCMHMAWFSWSVRHVLLPAYFAIVVVGGLYFVFATLVTRAVPRRWAAVAFAVASAASFWLRAEMPEICYPHGQPCHDLWRWPTLLAGVRVGGEPLVNALLAALSATSVQAYRSWRSAVPEWGAARRQLSFACAAALMVTALGNLWRGRAATGAEADSVRVGVVEPGVHPFDPALGRELFVERWLQPTRELLAQPDPPSLVLWPESSVPGDFTAAELQLARPALAFGLRLGATRLVYGTNLRREGGFTPIGMMVGDGGVVLGWQEKQCLVPGGEFLPFVAWLPEAARAEVHRMFRQALGSAPDCVPGDERAPLTTAAGVPFGVLTCYDNAFWGPAARQVAAGARFLCVISNEAWYRGGAELTQLVAMTVCRALETGVPVVRCTLDGWSVAVGADGELLAGLPLRPAPQASAQKMTIDVPLAGPGQGPMPWLPGSTGLAMAVLAGLALLHSLISWARLLSSRTAPQAATGAGVRSRGGASGS